MLMPFGRGHLLAHVDLLVWQFISTYCANIVHQRGNNGLILRLIRTGLVPTCIGALESSQERIHINICEFRRLVQGFVVRVVDQTDRIGWSPWCRRHP